MPRSAPLLGTIVLLLPLVPGPAGADDPSQALQEPVLCATAQQQATVLLVAARAAPGQLAPAPGPDGGATVDVCIRNNGHVLLRSADAAFPHRPVTTRDGGECLDARRDRGADLLAGDGLDLRFHWHNLTTFLVSVDAGAQKDCSDAPTSNTLQRTVLPWHCALHPDTLRGIILVKSGI